jgi:hypothetical protein
MKQKLLLQIAPLHIPIPRANLLSLPMLPIHQNQLTLHRHIANRRLR